MNANDPADRLVDAALELAWRQWTAIGVAGATPAAKTIVDPEALLLATLSIGRADARLFDEMLDWVATNASLVDMARLRRLAKHADSETRRLLAAVAELAVEHGARSSFRQIGYAALVAQESQATYDTEPLFGTGDSAGDWREPDELFERVGFTRGTPQLRGMSQQPRGSAPAALRFRARALVGLGPRAEVLVYMWTHDGAHGRLIATRAAYGQTAVAEYLAALELAGLAQRRDEGRKAEYVLDESLQSIARPVPTYVDWVRAWPAVIAVLDALKSGESLSEGAKWALLARTLDEQRVGLETEGFGVIVPKLAGWAVEGPGRLTAVLDGVAARLHELAL